MEKIVKQTRDIDNTGVFACAMVKGRQKEGSYMDWKVFHAGLKFDTN